MLLLSLSPSSSGQCMVQGSVTFVLCTTRLMGKSPQCACCGALGGKILPCERCRDPSTPSLPCHLAHILIPSSGPKATAVLATSCFAVTATVKGAGDATRAATMGLSQIPLHLAAICLAARTLLLARWPSGAECPLCVAAKEDGLLDHAHFNPQHTY